MNPIKPLANSNAYLFYTAGLPLFESLGELAKEIWHDIKYKFYWK